jgi:hypothetical protein
VVTRPLLPAPVEFRRSFAILAHSFTYIQLTFSARFLMSEISIAMMLQLWGISRKAIV